MCKLIGILDSLGMIQTMLLVEHPGLPLEVLQEKTKPLIEAGGKGVSSDALAVGLGVKTLRFAAYFDPKSELPIPAYISSFDLHSEASKARMVFVYPQGSNDPNNRVFGPKYHKINDFGGPKTLSFGSLDLLGLDAQCAYPWDAAPPKTSTQPCNCSV